MKISRGESLDRFYLFSLFGFGLFLHRIHHSDPMGVYHSHPWSGLSMFLGSYGECIKRPDGKVDFKIRYFWNWINAKQHHRVMILKPMWTLFFHLPRSNDWSIIDEKGNKVEVPWEGASGGVKSYAKALTEAETGVIDPAFFEPILLSHSDRIEERSGYVTYQEAIRRKLSKVRCRYLGSGDIVMVEIWKLNPMHFTPKDGGHICDGNRGHCAQDCNDVRSVS
jgi:hypothetical protein